MYNLHPELMNNLTIEQLIRSKEFYVETETGNTSKLIPGIPPLLFNFVFSIIANIKEFKDYQSNFPGYD